VSRFLCSGRGFTEVLFEFVWRHVACRFTPCAQPPLDAALLTNDVYMISRVREGEHRVFDPKAKYLKVRQLCPARDCITAAC
jgi:hypothetical protein